MNDPKDTATATVDELTPYDSASNGSTRPSKNDLFNDKPDLSAKGVSKYLSTR